LKREIFHIIKQKLNEEKFLLFFVFINIEEGVE